MKRTLRHHSMWAYVVLFAAAIIGLWVTQNNADEHSCERANEMRKEVNKRGGILHDFLTSAADTRADTAEIQRRQGRGAEATLNQDAADLWEQDAKRIERLTVVGCDKFP